jgi:hypothetical protein
MAEQVAALAESVKIQKGGLDETISNYSKIPYKQPQIVSEAEKDELHKSYQQYQALDKLKRAVALAIDFHEKDDSLTVSQLEEKAKINDIIAGLNGLSNEMGANQQKLMAAAVYLAMSWIYNISETAKPHSIAGQLNHALQFQKPDLIHSASKLLKEEIEKLNRLIKFLLSIKAVKMTSADEILTDLDSALATVLAECETPTSGKSRAALQQVSNHARNLKHILLENEGLFENDDLLCGTSTIF